MYNSSTVWHAFDSVCAKGMTDSKSSGMRGRLIGRKITTNRYLFISMSNPYCACTFLLREPTTTYEVNRVTKSSGRNMNSKSNQGMSKRGQKSFLHIIIGWTGLCGFFPFLTSVGKQSYICFSSCCLACLHSYSSALT